LSEDVTNHFVKTKFDLNNKEVVSVIDELSLWSAPFGLKLLDTIKLKKNITAIDIGFGLGFPLLEVAMRLGEGSKVYGIDPWEAAIERTKKKIKIYGIKNVELFNGFAEDIPLPDNSVDLIFSNNGTNNVKDQEKVFNECRRIAKKGAQFIFTFNLEGTMIEFYDTLKETLLEKGMLPEIETMKEHIYTKRKPIKEIITLVEKNGFKVIHVKEDSFFYSYTDGTTMLNHFLIRLAFIDSWKEILPPLRRVEIFNEIERKLNTIAVQNGETKLTVPFAVLDCEKL
jgi:ubiquinone/menaquinone biosynthesis C-methylase UbiE